MATCEFICHVMLSFILLTYDCVCFIKLFTFHSFAKEHVILHFLKIVLFYCWWCYEIFCCLVKLINFYCLIIKLFFWENVTPRLSMLSICYRKDTNSNFKFLKIKFLLRNVFFYQTTHLFKKQDYSCFIIHYF